MTDAPHQFTIDSALDIIVPFPADAQVLIVQWHPSFGQGTITDFEHAQRGAFLREHGRGAQGSMWLPPDPDARPSEGRLAPGIRVATHMRSSELWTFVLFAYVTQPDCRFTVVQREVADPMAVVMGDLPPGACGWLQGHGWVSSLGGGSEFYKGEMHPFIKVAAMDPQPGVRAVTNSEPVAAAAPQGQSDEGASESFVDTPERALTRALYDSGVLTHLTRSGTWAVVTVSSVELAAAQYADDDGPRKAIVDALDDEPEGFVKPTTTAQHVLDVLAAHGYRVVEG